MLRAERCPRLPFLIRSTAMTGARYVRIKRFAELTGYTEKAVYRKIADGVWIHGREYRRAPDGSLCIDLEGFQKWVENGQAPASSR